MNPVFPVLCDFTFVGITLYLDLYSIFSAEPMHEFHLGSSIMLKEAAMDRLRCTAKTTDS